MNARQRVLTMILIFFVLYGNCVNLLIARRQAVRIIRAAEPDYGEHGAADAAAASGAASASTASTSSAASADTIGNGQTVSQQNPDDPEAGPPGIVFPHAVFGLGRHPGVELVVAKAYNADGTEHDFQQCKLLHINWADGKELQELPGIGPALAGRIMEKRMERFFVEVKDLLLVPGIGEKRLAQIKPLICVAIPYVPE